MTPPPDSLDVPNSLDSPNSLDDRLRHILLNDWDPHNISGKSDWHTAPPLHHYDFVLADLKTLMAQNPREDDIVSFLADHEAATVCFPSAGRERLRRPARLLIAAFARDA